MGEVLGAGGEDIGGLGGHEGTVGMGDQAVVAVGRSVGGDGGGSDGDGGKTLGGKMLSLGSLDSGLIDGHDSSVRVSHKTAKVSGVGSVAGVGASVVQAVVSQGGGSAWKNMGRRYSHAYQLVSPSSALKEG